MKFRNSIIVFFAIGMICMFQARSQANPALDGQINFVEKMNNRCDVKVEFESQLTNSTFYIYRSTTLDSNSNVPDTQANMAGIIDGYNYYDSTGPGYISNYYYQFIDYNRCNGTWYYQLYCENVFRPYRYPISYAMKEIILSDCNCNSTDDDLIMHDTLNDTGVEPNNTGDNMWISKDIWVRQTPATIVNSNRLDGVGNRYEREHHDDDYLWYSTGSNPSYLYVKVRNRGGAISSGTDVLKVYWAKASTGLVWPTHWYNNLPYGDQMKDNSTGSYVAVQIPPLLPNQVWVHEIEWLPPDPGSFPPDPAHPNEQFHFCLLARIEESPSYPHGMTIPEDRFTQWSTIGNTINNNNIVWKNITIKNNQDPYFKTHDGVIIRNIADETASIRLSFKTQTGEFSFLNFGKIRVDLGRLYEPWKRGGFRNMGIEPIHGTTQFEITSPDAWIGGIRLEPKEEYVITVQTDYSQVVEEPMIFNFDIVQYTEGADLPDGAERYQIRINPS